MKNVITAATAVVLAVILFWACLGASAQNVYELDATVTDVENVNGHDVIVADVVHPDGSIQEWAFYGDADAYPVGSSAVVTIDLYHDIIQDARPA